MIIIPTYEAAEALNRLLSELSDYSVIVADGGSADGTLTIAAQHKARLVCGAKGRGQQLRLGAHLATLSGAEEDWFLFLHADSLMNEGWEDAIHAAMQQGDPRYFRFKANAEGSWAFFMNSMVALRCWALGLPYGDQGLLISRADYERVGGYAEMALFEDVDMVERLKKITRLRPLPCSLVTDVSRHQSDGLWTRGLSNLRLLWRYKRGIAIDMLRRDYG
ncbi:MAG: glycosyltransferase [Pseudomonadota bacterium]